MFEVHIGVHDPQEIVLLYHGGHDHSPHCRPFARLYRRSLHSLANSSCRALCWLVMMILILMECSCVWVMGMCVDGEMCVRMCEYVAKTLADIPITTCHASVPSVVLDNSSSNYLVRPFLVPITNLL